MKPARAVFLIALVAVPACRSTERAPPTATPRPEAATPAAPDPFAAARAKMVADTIERRGVKDPRVLEAMRRVPRHELVPEDQRHRSYEDNPLPIGWAQTISQPYIVAVMSEAAQVGPGKKVLEIGTGSGYQAAVLAELGAEVYSIEIVEPLARRTHELLAGLGYGNIHLRIGDGYRGWPEAAPFDAIVVTAAPEKLPQPLIDQLAVGGRMVIPVGPAGNQHLKVLTRTHEGATEEALFEVRFVPMTGEIQR
jgi:protein-L-isoaspartate(D-aspartate) O-methyltransferase